MPFTNISCQSNWHVYIIPVFYKCKHTLDVTKLSTKEVPGLQKHFSLKIYVLLTGYSYIDIKRTFKSNCENFLQFHIYTENRYMGTLSLAIVPISISITIGDGTEARSKGGPELVPGRELVHHH